MDNDDSSRSYFKEHLVIIEEDDDATIDTAVGMEANKQENQTSSKCDDSDDASLSDTEVSFPKKNLFVDFEAEEDDEMESDCEEEDEEMSDVDDEEMSEEEDEMSNDNQNMSEEEDKMSNDDENMSEKVDKASSDGEVSYDDKSTEEDNMVSGGEESPDAVLSDDDKSSKEDVMSEGCGKTSDDNLSDGAISSDDDNYGKRKKCLSFHKILLPPNTGVESYKDYISSIVAYVNQRNGNYSELALVSPEIEIQNSSSRVLNNGSREDFSTLQFVMTTPPEDNEDSSFMWFFYREKEIFCVTTGLFLGRFHKFEEYCCTRFPTEIRKRLVDRAVLRAANYVNILDGSTSRVSNDWAGVDIDINESICSFVEMPVRNKSSIYEFEPFIKYFGNGSLFIGCGYAHIQFSQDVRFVHVVPLLEYFSMILNAKPTYGLQSSDVEKDFDKILCQVEKVTEVEAEQLDLKLIDYLWDYGCKTSKNDQMNHKILDQFQIGNLEYNWPITTPETFKIHYGGDKKHLSTITYSVKELLDAAFEFEDIKETLKDANKSLFIHYVKEKLLVRFKFNEYTEKASSGLLDVFQGEMFIEGLGRFWKIFGSWNYLCDEFVRSIDQAFTATVIFHWVSRKYFTKVLELDGKPAKCISTTIIRAYFKLYENEYSNDSDTNDESEEEGVSSEAELKADKLKKTNDANMYISPCSTSSNTCCHKENTPEIDCYDENYIFGQMLINVKLLTPEKTETTFMFVVNGYGSGVVRKTLLDIECFMQKISFIESCNVDRKFRKEFLRFVDSHSDMLFKKKLQTAKKYVKLFLASELEHRTAKVVLGFTWMNVDGDIAAVNFDREFWRLQLYSVEDEDVRIEKLGKVIDVYLKDGLNIDKYDSNVKNELIEQRKNCLLNCLLGADAAKSKVWDIKEVSKALESKMQEKGYITCQGGFSGKMVKLADQKIDEENFVMLFDDKEYANVDKGLFMAFKRICLPCFKSQIDKIGLIRLCKNLKDFDVTIEDIEMVA